MTKLFSRYTKNLLTRKCGCPNLQNANVNILNQQADSIQPVHLQVAGQPVQMYMLDERKMYRQKKNLTVNPLPVSNVFNHFKAEVWEPVTYSLPSTKVSEASNRSADYSISNNNSQINKRNLDDSEPIYAEIKTRIREKTNQKNNNEFESKPNKPSLEKKDQETKGKKEIEYWQITAKEAVKFRPCTETFIVRE